MDGLLLVVEDDPSLREVIQLGLEGEGFQVATAEDGPSALISFASQKPDLLLLDVMLPGLDGFAVCREIRKVSLVPIIMLTARASTADVVEGLESGADDYVTKPFDLRELLARIRAVLRRSHAGDAPSSGTPSSALAFAGFRFDPLARSLHDANGAEVALTAGEYALLALFLHAPGRVLSRDYLIERLHGRSAGPYDRAIDVQVGRLRRKIETDQAQPALIRSVRGSGYVFSAGVQRC